MRKAWLVWEYFVDLDDMSHAQIKFEEPDGHAWAQIREIVWAEIIEPE